MTDLVPRTVTELSEDRPPVGRRIAPDDGFDRRDALAGDDSADWVKVRAEGEVGTEGKGSPTLEDFRDSGAYVLLGAPGAGKTELFKAEGKRDGCLYVTARDFLTFDINDMPEWRDATLFIDGLDEKRAGSEDGRTALDGIRSKLSALGHPTFRLSCREADWFGANDRVHLATVSKNREIKILRLDPLSDDGIFELIGRQPGIDDARAFMVEARARGVEYLLANPQNLEMLTRAVSDDVWPATRTQTFELACEELIHETHVEHRIANRDGPRGAALIGTARELSALLLLTGHEGYNEFGQRDYPEYLGLESVPDSECTTLHLALHSKLFTSPVEGGLRRAPIHRQVAEFLGARYLAELVEKGLPVGRVLALMTGEDGGIVSELRGLVAWLAAHCPQARGVLIERDPVGAAAYGDAGVFSREEKRRLLERLCPVDPSLDASLFTSLVTPDMVPVLLELLSDRKRDEEHRNLVLFLLCVLADATPLPELGEALLDLAESDDYPANSRISAAICLAEGVLEQPAQFESVVRRLFRSLRNGHIRDEGKSMLGRLLQFLYPKFIGPDEIFDYLDEDHASDRYIGDAPGPYDDFWQHYLTMETRPGDVAIILDRLEEVFERYEEWRRTGRPPVSSLARAARLLVQKALDRTEEHEPRRTLRWLRLAGGDDWGSSQSSNAIRGWIEARPERYKELLREGVAQAVRSGNFESTIRKAKRSLHGARAPADYGRWCLGEIERVEGNEDLAKCWFKEAWWALRNAIGADGLTLEHLEAAAARHAHLVPVIEDLRSTDLRDPVAKLERENRQSTLVRRRKQAETLAEHRRLYGQYEEALRENRCPAGLLNTIAEAYLGHYIDFEGENGEQRLHKLLGDDTLIEAAMDGLRNSIHRDDLPFPRDVLALRCDNRRHALAFPVVAGLELIPADDVARLEDQRARLAIAMFLASRPPTPEPGWVRLLFESRPELAAEEVVRIAAMAMRRGERQVPFVHEMVSYTWLSEVAQFTCHKLLRSFPVRAPQHLHDLLRRLLWWGIENLNSSTMESVVTHKLRAKSMTAAQRSYWLATQFVLAAKPDLASIQGFSENCEKAVSGFVALLDHSPYQRRLLDRLPSPLIGELARRLGTARRPQSDNLAMRVEVRESDLVRVLLEVLGTRTDDEAVSALMEIGDDPPMAAWHATVRRVQQEQRVIRRDAFYLHPNVEVVCRTLACRQPANVADLAALTFEHISTIARNIRHGYTNDWRQYWATGGESWRPAHEDDCRDALLSDLQARLLTLGVEAAPEGRYADEKRSDIRVFYGGFNVPVEIKKSSSRDLWRALRNQLIARYTRDPGAAGYGIYLVFWFGNEPDPCQMPESGSRLRSAAELEERLRGTLSAEEARLISVCVIDVSRP